MAILMLFLINNAAIMSDPRIIPDFWLNFSYFGIAIGLISIILGIAPYFLNNIPESRTKGFVKFSMIYLMLILSFANIYYLIRDDFISSQDDFTSDDAVFKELVKKSNDLKSKIQKPQLNAQLEYKKKKDLESKKKDLEDIMKMKITMDMNMDMKTQQSLHTYDPPYAQYWQDYNRVEDSLNHLNTNLISEYEVYLTTKLLADSADAEIWKYTYFNFIYFSTVTIVTVGYGDIKSKTRTAKMFVTLEILSSVFLVLIYLGLVMR